MLLITTEMPNCRFCVRARISSTISYQLLVILPILKLFKQIFFLMEQLSVSVRTSVNIMFVVRRREMWAPRNMCNIVLLEVADFTSDYKRSLYGKN